MKKLITLILLLVGGVSMVHAANNYLVVGASIVCNGENWNNNADVNVMQTSDEGVTYTLTIENLTLETGVNYEYKIVEKGSWTEYYPNTGVNASFSVGETAVYTITYTYTVSTSTCQVTTTKTGEAGPIAHTYNITGNNITLFGANWDPTNTATDMSDENGDGIYTWEKSDVTLTTEPIEFKVTVDHSWDVSYPASNYQLVIPEDGTYKVTITFNPGTHEVSATAIKTTEEFTISAEGWATAKTTYAVDFTGVEGIEAYTATVSGETVTLHKVGPVPAGTALVLKGETKEVPTIESAEALSNDLKWYDNYKVNDSYRHVYGLVKTDGKAQFTRVKNGENITNKAILELAPSASRELKVVFDDETTGISQIENTQPATKIDGAIYNLNGQRVMNPGKGLYIINGKKVIMK